MNDVATTRGGVPAPLTLDELKNLCQVVTAGMGLTVEAVQHYGRHTDLFLGCTVLLRPRRILMRLTTDEADLTSISETAMEAHRRGCADHVLLTTHPLPDGDPTDPEHVMGPAAFFDLLQASYTVGWHHGRPMPRRDAYQLARRRAELLQEHDRIGLAWMPALSRFRLPWQLRDSRVPADEWFERVVFQLATTVFRLGGVRLGTARRGQRVGDALLWSGQQTALLDCKAAQDGYKLGIDDERRLLEYASTTYPEYGFPERPQCVVLVSSSFPTFEQSPRRFTERRKRFIDAGSNLACIRADDLVDGTLALLNGLQDTRAVDALPWSQILAEGMVTRETLLGICAVQPGRS